MLVLPRRPFNSPRVAMAIPELWLITLEAFVFRRYVKRSSNFLEKIELFVEILLHNFVFCVKRTALEQNEILEKRHVWYKSSLCLNLFPWQLVFFFMTTVCC